MLGSQKLTYSFEFEKTYLIQKLSILVDISNLSCTGVKSSFTRAVISRQRLWWFLKKVLAPRQEKSPSHRILWRFDSIQFTGHVSTSLPATNLSKAFLEMAKAECVPPLCLDALAIEPPKSSSRYTHVTFGFTKSFSHNSCAMWNFGLNFQSPSAVFFSSSTYRSKNFLQ